MGSALMGLHPRERCADHKDTLGRRCHKGNNRGPIGESEGLSGGGGGMEKGPLGEGGERINPLSQGKACDRLLPGVWVGKSRRAGQGGWTSWVRDSRRVGHGLETSPQAAASHQGRSGVWSHAGCMGFTGGLSKAWGGTPRAAMWRNELWRSRGDEGVGAP